MRPFLQRFRGKTRLRVAILTVFCTLLALALGVTITYSYIGMGKIIEDYSRDSVIKTQQSIVDQVTSYFGPVFRVGQIGAWVTLKVPTKPTANKSLEAFMVGAILFIQQATYIYVADEDGDFLGVFALGHKRISMTDPNKPLPHGAKVIVERLKVGHPWRSLMYLDEQGRVLFKETVPLTFFNQDVYDPRKRPWYQMAQKTRRALWTEPFQNWEESQLSLTASTPMMSPQNTFLGVIGADIPIRKLSEVLARQKASRSGLNFLINDKGDLLGYSLMDRLLDQKSLGSIRDVNEPFVKHAYELYKKNQQPQFSFSHGGISYLAYFLNFPKIINENWVLGMVAPTDDFVGPVNRMHREVAYISLAILLLGVFLLVIFSQGISYPIEVLADHMRRLKDLEITRDPLPKTRLQEIAQMEEAMDLVKEGLSSFSKYVPKDLVLDLIQSGSSLNLGGEQKRLTIFFSDIKNFTGLAESMPPNELMTQVSGYFSELSRIILSERGTIDKFIGDSIMAFWGAPKADPDQIIHGCRAMLRCYQISLTKAYQQSKYGMFQTRFGLHDAQVTVGNVGSSDRMNYTIFGDGVNVASRLEGANKLYGTHCLVSHSVYERAKEVFLFRPVDCVALAGRQEGMMVYELMEEKSDSQTFHDLNAMARLTSQAFDAYQDKNFSKALDLYQKVQDHQKGKDPLASIFIQRCQALSQHPPSSWDGVFRYSKKDVID